MAAPAHKSKLIKGATGDWEVVIGMEVHAQVTAEAKRPAASGSLKAEWTAIARGLLKDARD